ncbi:DNA polymerase alpha, subunit B [Sparassis latifolia]
MASLSEAGLRREILEKFGDRLDEKLVPECVKLCQIYNISGENLWYKWEALKYKSSGPKHLNSDDVQQFTMDSIQALKEQAQSDLAKAKKQQGKAQLTGPLNRNMLNGMMRPNMRSPMGPPIRTPARPAVLPSKVRYVGPSNDAESRKQRAYWYMYEKISERSEALDNRIDDFGELVKEHYGIEDLSDPSAATEEEVTAVGRIALDSESSSGSVKLNEASLTLELSRMMGSGARVPLRFDSNVKLRGGSQGSGGVGLFPGAIVALRGKNGGGGWFSVSEILSLPGLKTPPRNNMNVDSDSSFSAFVACGPFSPDADLSFNPWHKLISKLKTEKPAVSILVGPFIDNAHPLVKSGDIDTTPAELFRQTFTATLREYLDSAPGALVLIVPSVRDIISDHAVFPQSELGFEFSGDPRMHLLPNPCQFTLNDLSFGVSSVDVIFHLRKEEFFKRAQEVESISSQGDTTQAGDPMTNTCRHLLQQRSFYPIFPVPFDLSHEVNLDITHSEALKLAGLDSAASAPDVLITPSRLKHFSKVTSPHSFMVDSTLFMNPSFLTKGMFATMSYAGSGDNDLPDRLKADILKLDA